MKKIVVYIKNDESYEITLKETKKQMKDFAGENDKVIYIRCDFTSIQILEA
jgi:hypothetical protein